MVSAVRQQVDKAQAGSWFRVSELGGGNAAEQALSRLARDPASSVVRAAKGLYFKAGPPDPFFGKRKPAPVEVAKRVAPSQGVGPAEAFASSYLGLTTQVAPRPMLTIVGTPPRVEGVDWKVRRNPVRALLNFTEVAVLELLALYPYGTEAEWDEVVDRIRELRDTNGIDLGRIQKTVATERRKPVLRRNYERLVADLEA
jgi:hypothetical protein